MFLKWSQSQKDLPWNPLLFISSYFSSVLLSLIRAALTFVVSAACPASSRFVNLFIQYPISWKRIARPS